METDTLTQRKSQSKEIFESISQAYALANLPKTRGMVGPYYFSRKPLREGHSIRFEKGNSTTWFNADNSGVTEFGNVSEAPLGPNYSLVKPGSLVSGIVHSCSGGRLEFNYRWQEENNIPVLRSLEIVELGRDSSSVLYRKLKNWIAESSGKRQKSILEQAPERLLFKEPVFGVEVPPYLVTDFDKLQKCYLERFGMMDFLDYVTLKYPTAHPRKLAIA